MAWKLTGKHLDERTGEQVYDPYPGIAWADAETEEQEEAFRAAVRDYARREGLSDRTLFANGLFGFFEHVDERPDKPVTAVVEEKE